MRTTNFFNIVVSGEIDLIENCLRDVVTWHVFLHNRLEFSPQRRNQPAGTVQYPMLHPGGLNKTGRQTAGYM